MRSYYIKFLIAIASWVVIFLSINFPNAYSVKAETNFFAQVQKSGVYLNSTPAPSPIFEIPKTFYVELLEDKKDGYYKAQYMDIVGYVNASDIQCVSEIPLTPYLNNINFRILGEQSSELRSEPSRAKGLSTLISELPLYETNFTYYGIIEGDEVVPDRTNLWFYAKYTKNNLSKVGYIYSGLTDKLTPITYNELSLYPIDSHVWKIETEDALAPTTPSFEPPTTNQLLIILAITIPMLILLIAIFRPARAKNTKHNTHKAEVIRMPNTVTQIPKRRNRKTDYYELE